MRYEITKFQSKPSRQRRPSFGAVSPWMLMLLVSMIVLSVFFRRSIIEAIGSMIGIFL